MQVLGDDAQPTWPPAGLREVASEFLGTAFLLCAVVGSGVMGERLCGGNVAVALLANSLATAAALYVLISAAAPWSGAHFNPLVSLVASAQAELPASRLPGYLLAQLTGAFAGVAVANRMFDLPIFSASHHVRTGAGQWLGEFVASLGLLLTIRLVGASSPRRIASSVACFIGAAYWFTSSTSFANPAATLARSLSDTFAGIRPLDVPGFVVAEALAGAAVVATGRMRWPRAKREVLPMPDPPATVLFACVHNAGRSQMAAAWFEALADPSRARAISAGTQPAARPHPEVVAAMREAGIEIGEVKPRFLSDQLALQAQLLVTMGCQESCPVVPGVRRLDWALDDPKGRPLEEVRRIRDQIRERVAALIEANGWGRGAPAGSR
jgi:glycerol uptake facilitator-like aquaporin/protein-tyrosine-phosphatase